jgi:phosphoribosylglycinamide formyltransferase-1
MYTFGAFSTLRDHAAVDLFKRIFEDMGSGYISAELPYIFCNREPEDNRETDRYSAWLSDYIGKNGFGTKIVRFSSKKFAERSGKGADYYESAMSYLEDVGFDARNTNNLMIGFMKIVPAETTNKYTFINLHPAVPWGFTGAWEEVIWSQILDDSQTVGAMIHIATEEMDRGPVISYTHRAISPGTGNMMISLGSDLRKLYLDDPERFEELKNKQYKDNPTHRKMMVLHRAMRGDQFALESPLISVTMRGLGKGEVVITPEKDILKRSGKNLIKVFKDGICMNALVSEYMKDHGIEDWDYGWDDI